VVGIDQRYVAGLGLVVPGACNGLAAGVLGRRDDDEILVREIFVNSLPT
jgi:hypothetical protein